MGAVADAFGALKHNLEITQTEQDLASSRHAAVREKVRGEWALEDDFLTGSYRRHTKTKRLKDVDTFVVIDRSGPQGHLRDEAPAVVLGDLLTLLQTKWPAAYLDAMAVVIPYGRDEDITSMEVVPAFKRAGGGYEIPNPVSGGWLATDPKVHHELSSAKNAECENNYVPFVKMIKATNRELGEPVSPSFLLEVMAMSMVRAPFGTFQDELVTFFATAAERVSEEFNDPAGLGGNVNTAMSAEQMANARRALQQAQEIAENAVDLEDDGQERTAVYEWIKLFGRRMPQP